RQCVRACAELYRVVRLLGPRIADAAVGPLELPVASQGDRIDDRTRGVADLLLDGGIAIERIMARRVRLVVADVAIDCGAGRLDEIHVRQPSGQRVPERLRAGGVA